MSPASGPHDVPRIATVEPSTTARTITVVEHTNFAVSDLAGDIVPGSYGGLFVGDTRVLSRLALRVGGRYLEPLSAATAAHGRASFYLANPRLRDVPRSSLVVFRDRHINRRLEERIRLISYAAEPLDVEVSVETEADFADIFEVRGARRRWRRTVHRDAGPRRAEFAYQRGGHTRRTMVTFSRSMTPSAGGHTVVARLERGRPWDLNVTVRTERHHTRDSVPPPPERRVAPELVSRWLERAPDVSSTDLRLVTAWRQGLRDIASLLLTGPAGNFLPAAGLPWFLAVFGRDACITAMQTMLLGPEIPFGTLRQLALYQGTRTDRWREEQPGKIPHEVRTGELATLGVLPFSRYYGSVDSTPLYVMLFAEACRWSGWPSSRPRPLPVPADGSVDPPAEFLPAVEGAIAWIDASVDSDGLLWYEPAHRSGLVNQVWKDSGDSMRYADGTLAAPPIAAVEVQGYVIAARRGLAEVYASLGRHEEARAQAAAAERLADIVERELWMPEEATYALGLDARRRRIDAVGSNAGHLLWCGVPDARRAAAIAERLLAPDMFSGWGLRTLSNANPGYNPIGYHIGSVWPHDTSLFAAGLARYGLHDAATRVIDALLDAVDREPMKRLSELYAGFDRVATPDLVPYPTACSPQAWATGAIFLSARALMRAGGESAPSLLAREADAASGWADPDAV